MTNFERITKSPEALAKALTDSIGRKMSACILCAYDARNGGICDFEHDCRAGICDWLKTEYEEPDSWSKVYEDIEVVFTSPFMRGRMEATRLMELPARIERLRETENGKGDA